MAEAGWQRAGGENGQIVEPNFDDPEDFIDDIPDEELMPDLLARVSFEIIQLGLYC